MTKLILLIPAIAFVFSVLAYTILRVWGRYKSTKRAIQLDGLKKNDLIIISHPRYCKNANFIARNGDKMRVYAWTKLDWNKEYIIIDCIHFLKTHNG